jgi:hypothetical protein
LQEFLQPGIHARAVADNHVRPLHLLQISTGELIVVRADVGWEQVFHLSQAPSDVLGKAIEWEEGREDMQLLAAGRLSSMACESQGKRQQELAGNLHSSTLSWFLLIANRLQYPGRKNPALLGAG